MNELLGAKPARKYSGLLHAGCQLRVICVYRNPSLFNDAVLLMDVSIDLVTVPPSAKIVLGLAVITELRIIDS